MGDDNAKNLAEGLRAWGPLVSSGYEVPAAGTVMHQAADELDQLATSLALERVRADTACAERDEARKLLRRKWCLSCGTITTDEDCDCTTYQDDADAQNLVDFADEIMKQLREVHARADTLTRERDAVRAALEPFARYSDFFPDAIPDMDVTNCHFPGCPTMGDCHRARALLDASGRGQEGER